MNAGSPAGGRFTAGSLLAGYRIEARIGRGGMATVFRAHDERLGRTVALKILAPALAVDKEFRTRFIRESRAAAGTDHPHIIPVFEAGDSGDVLFIAMRFVRGGDLRSRLKQYGPFPLDTLANVVSQTSSALDAANKRGLVHRDVKPANILLDVGEDTGRPDHAYLSDFGLSKDALAAGTVTALTVAGQVLGTLDYMSPEQIDGQPVDGRTDQYGLACTAYELLCGMPPFGQHPGAALMRAHRSYAPLPITSRRLDLPAGTDAVFERALSKPPEDRYESCSEFASMLRVAFGLGPYRAGQDVSTSGIAAVHARPVIRAVPPDASPAPPAASPASPMPRVPAVIPSTAPTVQRKSPAGKATPAYQDRTEIDANKPPPTSPAT